jgi:hypothetical protein
MDAASAHFLCSLVDQQRYKSKRKHDNGDGAGGDNAEGGEGVSTTAAAMLTAAGLPAASPSIYRDRLVDDDTGCEYLFAYDYGEGDLSRCRIPFEALHRLCEYLASVFTFIECTFCHRACCIPFEALHRLCECSASVSFSLYMSHSI